MSHDPYQPPATDDAGHPREPIGGVRLLASILSFASSGVAAYTAVGSFDENMLSLRTSQTSGYVFGLALSVSISVLSLVGGVRLLRDRTRTTLLIWIHSITFLLCAAGIMTVAEVRGDPLLWARALVALGGMVFTGLVRSANQARLLPERSAKGGG